MSVDITNINNWCYWSGINCNSYSMNRPDRDYSFKLCSATCTVDGSKQPLRISISLFWETVNVVWHCDNIFLELLLIVYTIWSIWRVQNDLHNKPYCHQSVKHLMDIIPLQSTPIVSSCNYPILNIFLYLLSIVSEPRRFIL